MPRHVVDLAAEALNDRSRSLKGARVGVLGVAFKPDVGDAREAPAEHVLALLRERGAEVRFHDPHIARFRDASGRVDDSTPLDELLGWAELLVIVTAHRAVDWDAVYARGELILDTVNASRNRALRPRQVLRLGAGWSA
jgi:UDP-N-acetyl-D-glucosamine dehydrogenase